MEEKYPIKFTLGQFILLGGVAIILLSLAFIFGARFGGQVFPEYYAKQFLKKGAYASLAPEPKRAGEAAPNSDKLVDTLEDDEEESVEGEVIEGEEPADVPHYKIGADGASEPLNDEALEAEDAEELESESLSINKRLINTQADKNTMIRFKSSAHSRFTVEVADYFDELLASKKITNLKGNGFEAYIHIKNPRATSPAYSVRVGAFADRKVAEEFATKMSNRQNLELRVVKMD